MRRTSRAAATALSVTLLALAGGVPAASAADDDGLWYYDLFNMQVIHDSGITGAGVTIAVLDSQINPDAPALAGADVRVQPSLCYDESGTQLEAEATGPEAIHATRVVSMIVGNGSSVKGVAPDATVLLYNNSGPEQADGFASCLGPGGVEDFASDGAAVLLAVKAGADIISVSAGLSATPELIAAIALAESKGVVILGAVANTSNSTEAFQPSLPANSNGVVGVQSIDVNGKVLDDDGSPKADANTDVAAPGVRILAQGVESGGTVDWSAETLSTGTSYATPIVAGMLALVKQKYPDATGNQLIQTLIRNTGAVDHPLIFDANFVTGYGVPSATRMLTVDPAQYDDVNPLLVEGPNALPTAEMVANPESLDDWLDSVYGTGAAAADPEPTDPGSAVASILPVVIVVGVVALLVIVGILVLVLVISRSRRTAARTGGER